MMCHYNSPDKMASFIKGVNLTSNQLLQSYKIVILQTARIIKIMKVFIHELLEDGECIGN